MRVIGSRRHLGVVALVVAGALAAAVPATAAPGGDVPEVVDVDGVEVPVLGTFAVSGAGESDGAPVRGAVHGVQRVDGATVLYFSAGLPAGADKSFQPATMFREPAGGAIDNLALVDPEGLKYYRPLYDDGRAVASELHSGFVDAGGLMVMWAVFPELPAEVSAVDVLVGYSVASVPDVPVAEGLLEPVVDEDVVTLGQGWPEVPGADEWSGLDQEASVFDLARRSVSADGAAARSETTEQVTATLDANVLFDKSSAALTPAAQETLAGVAADIAARGTGEVVVTGHTDSDGSSESNQVLSQQRAQAVVAALEPGAGGAVTFSAVGRGEDEPVAPNDSPENMQLNRRVTVVYSIEVK